MTALRYIDLVLLWLTVPLALVLGAPQLGVLVAAGVWTVQRFVALAVDRKVAAPKAAREAIALNMATMFARLWLMAGAVVVAGVGASREDGVAAAAVLLVAFTISLAATLLIRSLSRAGGSPPGSPSHA
ncbi:MAG TPA: hypothetical protein VF526_03945 [Solirubrobacteraceae bacterium]|jgi:hypothetical protein